MGTNMSCFLTHGVYKQASN